MATEQISVAQNKENRIARNWNILFGLITFIGGMLLWYSKDISSEVGNLTGTLVTYMNNNNAIQYELKKDIKDYQVVKTKLEAKNQEQDKRLDKIEKKIN